MSGDRHRGLSWKRLAAELGTPEVWTVAALLGQHPLTAGKAHQVCALLGLGEDVAESLRRQPSRGSDEAPLRDQTVYRFVDAVPVYGPALKELILEKFGPLVAASGPGRAVAPAGCPARSRAATGVGPQASGVIPSTLSTV